MRRARAARPKTKEQATPPAEPDHVLLDHVWLAWIELTPAERLRRSWEMRGRLPDPHAVHDAKLFPSP